MSNTFQAENVHCVLTPRTRNPSCALSLSRWWKISGQFNFSVRSCSHRTRKQICRQICAQALWYCVQPGVNTPIDHNVFQICIHLLWGALRPVWTGPWDFAFWVERTSWSKQMLLNLHKKSWSDDWHWVYLFIKRAVQRPGRAQSWLVYGRVGQGARNGPALTTTSGTRTTDNSMAISSLSPTGPLCFQLLSKLSPLPPSKSYLAFLPCLILVKWAEKSRVWVQSQQCNKSCFTPVQLAASLSARQQRWTKAPDLLSILLW